ncbi:formimidoylglutamate deiminase [Goodfellowiella coeruleoviolacea]|uniref:Formiminoglutamate deiminase n=1 Tax=Goodfellowiella coeruleoviolacea TaxID=334858 RepID=A0AAE3KJ36_9PSEU|nr:formimidoylglutamate deiminase [Goodfellowiella coeruleoviolacea]MCP2168019.1 formiminoglutamate deiminase [Goodfellowiella coeruleoviolacea]
MSAGSGRFWCAHAWLPGGLAAGVLVSCADDGTISAVELVDQPPPGAEVLAGVVLPGFANAHSHVFHRALRGRTHGDGGTFWTWREAMYALAARLDPDSYLGLATAVFAEMAVAGITCVGEFHYLHHDRDGRRYADPNAMAEALREAARRAGVRLTLLDTCYLAGGIGRELAGTQRRFGDGSARQWADRHAGLRPDANTRIGAAIHSVRAVPADQVADVLAGAGPDQPLHVHLSEQPAENADCLAAHGCTPTRLLHDAGVLGPRTTAVHATHLTAEDIGLLGGTGTAVCLCPSTEADLGDGLGPAGDLAEAGCPISLGTDQSALIDMLGEARALEYGERLRTGRRGRFTPAELVGALTAAGHTALGWPGAGRIAPGAPADLVMVDPGTVRTAGALPEQVPLVASAADVAEVVVGGAVVARDGEHARLGDVAALLRAEVTALWR